MGIRMVMVAAGVALAAGTAYGQPALHGFVQGNYAVRTIGTDRRAGSGRDVMKAEERLQLRLDPASANGLAGAFARVDFARDVVGGASMVDVREASAAINSRRFSARVGRQVLTWGLGDLLFINDVFPKDWVAFLTGAPLEYLKIGSDAMRLGFYPGPFEAELAVIPVFDPDRVPTGAPLFFYDPMPGLVDRTTRRPPADLENAQVAARLYRSFGRQEIALYASRGFFGTPGARPEEAEGHSRLVFFYPRLVTYGVSAQGPLLTGVLSLEAGYYDSRDDPSGKDPAIENSQIRGLLAYQLQPWPEASLSAQYYAEGMRQYGAYRASTPPTAPVRERTRQVMGLRLRQWLWHQTLQLGLFALGSPTDEDLYFTPSARYQITDELWAEIGGNIFEGKEEHTFYGQFEKNSHLYGIMRYAF